MSNTGNTSALSSSDQQHQLVEKVFERLDLNTSTTEELQLARVYTRKRQDLAFNNYNSDNDASDTDSEDGALQNEKKYHDNGQPRHFRTYQINYNSQGIPYERIIEEKHFDIDGVCRLDVHFGLGQPYLSRKHYWANQRLKSESLFWIDDEESMSCHKTGHWRTYYDTGNIKDELQYKDGIRIGFCKRYNDDGTVRWVKDYTKSYLQKIDEFHQKKDSLSFTITDAYQLLGFQQLPATIKQLNSQYRNKCAPFHPDKSPDPDSTDEFIALSRARDVLQDYLEKHQDDSDNNHASNGATTTNETN